MKKIADNRMKVVAARVGPEIEHTLRLLAEATGRKQSFFLQQIIEQGIGPMEETWLPAATVARIGNGELPELPHAGMTPDLFSG